MYTITITSHNYHTHVEKNGEKSGKRSTVIVASISTDFTTAEVCRVCNSLNSL